MGDHDDISLTSPTLLVRVCTADLSHSIDASKLNPALDAPRSNPPTPENNDTARIPGFCQPILRTAREATRDDASLTVSYNPCGVGRRGLAIATLEKPRVGVRSPARGYAFCKRTLDILIASIALAVFSPLVVVVALAVRLTSPGSALFRHERVGLHGRVFRAWKFRTMRADRPLPPELAAQFEVNYKLTDDPRITGVGRWLRRTSIDEIPQLVNVLRGEMSLVGPRPVTRAELQQKYRDDVEEFLSVKPGLTGLWQVSGRTSLSYEERVQLDLRYARECDLLLDLGILARTPAAVLLMRGAE